MRNNWITFFDTSADGRVVYVSESVTEYTQFEPQDIIGRTAFSIFHPDDNANIKNAHLQNVFNERMSSMSTYRHLCKDGSYVEIACVVIYCYDLMVACNYILDVDSVEHKMRVSSIDESYVCIPNGPLQKESTWKVHRDLKITKDELWVNNQLTKPPERRVCLVLNRFTDDLEIVYASTLSLEVLGLDPATCLGTSIYDYLPEIDCLSLQTHMNLAKKHDMLFRLRFDWNVDGVRGVSEQVEGLVSSADDGFVLVLRLAPRTILHF